MLKRLRDSLLLVGSVVSMLSIVGYAWSYSGDNYKKAENMRNNFFTAADTNNDGTVTLAEQEEYLKSHGIKLQTVRIGGKEVATLEGFPFYNGNISRYRNAQLSTARELNMLEKNLVISPEYLTSSETLSNSR